MHGGDAVGLHCWGQGQGCRRVSTPTVAVLCALTCWHGTPCWQGCGQGHLHGTHLTYCGPRTPPGHSEIDAPWACRFCSRGSVWEQPSCSLGSFLRGGLWMPGPLERSVSFSPASDKEDEPGSWPVVQRGPCAYCDSPGTRARPVACMQHPGLIGHSNWAPLPAASRRPGSGLSAEPWAHSGDREADAENLREQAWGLPPCSFLFPLHLCCSHLPTPLLGLGAIGGAR